jgi:hypothetical protein
MALAEVTVHLDDDLKARFQEIQDGVYAERNQLVALLSHIYPSHISIDENADEGWQHVVCIHLLWQEPTVFGDARNHLGPRYAWHISQAAWHIPDREVPLFAHLPVQPNDWDGHETPEKYERLKRAGHYFTPMMLTEAVAVLGSGT